MITSDKPSYQEFNISGVRHIAPLNAYAELQNSTAILVDVREESEFRHESISLNDVYYYPMSGILTQLQNIPSDKPIIVVCNAGIRSSKVVNLLNLSGFINSANLDGGIQMWKAHGLPVNCDSGPACGCACSCTK